MMRVTLRNLNDPIFNSQHLFTKILMHKKEYKIMNKANQYKKEIYKDIKRLRGLRPVASKDKSVKRKLSSFSIQENHKSTIDHVSPKKEIMQLQVPSRSMPNMTKAVFITTKSKGEEEKQNTNTNTSIVPNTFFNTKSKKNKLLSHNKSASFIHLYHNNTKEYNKSNTNNSNDIPIQQLKTLINIKQKKALVSLKNSYNQSTVIQDYNLYHQSRNVIKDNKLHLFLSSSGYMKKKIIQYINMSKYIEHNSRRMAHQCNKINQEISVNERNLSKITLDIINKTKEKSEAQLFEKLISNCNSAFCKNNHRDTFWNIAQRTKLQKNLNIFRNLNEEVAFKQKQYITHKMHLFRDYSN